MSYRIIAQYAIDNSTVGAKQFIGSKVDRCCRFCGRDKTRTTFKKQAHVIPQAIGNRTLLSYDECDICNAQGGKLEDDFAKYLSILRPFAGTRIGGKGSVKLKPGQHSYVKGNCSDNSITVELNSMDPCVKVERIDSNNLKITVKRPPLTVLNVAKTLGRMIWYVLPKEKLDCYKHLLEWLRGEISPLPVYFAEGFRAGPPSTVTALTIFEETEKVPLVPPIIGMLAWGNTVFLFWVPKDKSFQLPELNLIAHPFMAAFKWKFIKCNTERKVKQIPESLSLNFESSSSDLPEFLP